MPLNDLYSGSKKFITQFALFLTFFICNPKPFGAEYFTSFNGRKFNVRDGEKVIVYDTRDGKRDKIIPAMYFNSKNVCMVW